MVILGLPPLPPINDVVFVVEGTALNGIFMHELRTHYVAQILEHFLGGTPAVPWAALNCSTSFTLVTFQGSDCIPG